MPCIRDDNGLPVPGSKGSCPIGSTWSDSNMVNLVHSQADRIAGQEALAGDRVVAPTTSDGKLFRDSRIFGKWFDPKNYTESPLRDWTGSLQSYINEKPSLSKIDKRMNELFGMTGLDDYTAIKKEGEPAPVSSPTYKGGREARGDRKPPKKLSKWEQFSANFKDPDWWMKNMSGLPHDTRLHRLGMLMDYYGKTPKGRAAVDMPAEVWARNEQAALEARAKAKEAAAKAKPDAYKWSFDDVQEAASIFFDEKFGKDWPFGKDKDESKALFMADLTDSKRRNPQVDLIELAEELMKQYPDRYI